MLKITDYAVTAQSIFKKYGEITALNDFSWKAKEGKIHALVGPSGSGKTTLLNILAGTVRPTNGTCKIFDVPSGSLEAMKIIGYVPAQPAFIPSMNLLDYLVYMGMLSGTSQLEAISRAIALLKKVDLNSFREKKPADLTPGMKNKVAIVQSLMAKPRLLLLDEPVSGLDRTAKTSVLQIIKKLSSEEETTAVITAEDWTDLESIADRVTLLKQGRVLLGGETSEIRDLFSHGVFALATTDNNRLLTILIRMGYLRQIIRTEKDSLIVITREPERFRKDIAGIIYKLNIELLTFQREDLTMEIITRCLTGEGGE